MAASGKQFTIDKQAGPVEFWTWLVNRLHADLTGGKLKKQSIISRCFQAGPRAAPARSISLERLR